MPIYEFRCKKCKNIFGKLIFSSKKKKNFLVLNVEQKLSKGYVSTATRKSRVH